MFQLSLVGGSIEVALRPSNEPIRTDFPGLESADTDPVPSSARPAVCTGKRPMIKDALATNDEIVHENLQVRKRGHEPAGKLGNGISPHGRSSAIHT